jgi:hypothetical protein
VREDVAGGVVAGGDGETQVTGPVPELGDDLFRTLAEKVSRETVDGAIHEWSP